MSVVKSAAEQDEFGAEEVAAVYRTVTVAVLAALAASFAMAVILVTLGVVDALRGTLFVVYLGALSMSHILLRRGYMRDPARAVHWRRWGYAFAAVTLMEGIGWGWTSFGLVAYDNMQLEVFCLFVSGGVAVASIPVFGSYLPAFLAFYIPAALPFAICDALSRNPLQRGATVLVLTYFVAMLIFGVAFNRSFRRLVGLRIRSDKLAADLRMQVELTEAANRAKSTFLAAASHDLRQPVHAVGLFIGALRGLPMSDDAMRIIEQIEASSQAMDSLFAALLDISRLDAGIVEVHTRTFAIDAVLNRICSEYAGEATGKSLVLRYRPCSAYVSSDPILIERILRNLVANAVRYTQTGGVLVGCRHRGNTLVTQVWDTGPGIPLDQQERVFQEYYQLGNFERDRAKGLGLGLAIVRRLTSLLEIPLRLTSHLGSGSRFEIGLPLSSAQDASQASQDDIGYPALHEGRLIVVIDDEAPIRAAMFSLLSGWGHDVVTAGTGAEAVALLVDFPRRPDLIICDLRLHAGETGLTAIELLRSEYNETIPAVLVTGDTAPDRLAEARASGLLLLHKPFSNGRLRAALANVILQTEPVAPEDQNG